MKTCQENLWHIYMMCYFNLVIGWRMQGWLKGQSHILKIAMMVPRRRLSRAIAATFCSDPAGEGRARRPRGPNVKKTTWIWRENGSTSSTTKFFFVFFFHICRCSTCVRGSLEANPGLLTSNLLLSYLILIVIWDRCHPGFVNMSNKPLITIVQGLALLTLSWDKILVN